MNRSWKLVLAGVLAFSASASQALACGGGCHHYYYGAPRVVQPVLPPQVQVDPGLGAGGPAIGDLAGGDVAGGDQIINDLPADAKLLIRRTAAKARVQSRGRSLQSSFGRFRN